MRSRYLAGPDPEKLKGKAWRGRKAGGASGGHSGVARSKHLIHPIGCSGRTLGALQRAFRERSK